ncbi:MAG: hypothetical protein E4G92_05250 [Bacteroidia bacterium]|nr:MAG: hypothetical protein E4G92_05250 [Bacteroidia bacterium]
MNNLCKVFALVFLLTNLVVSENVHAQTEKSASWSAGADIYSSFVWRGTRLGSGPAIQPVIEFTSGPFTAGAWGSYDFNDYQEVDLYISLALPAGFNIGITDYYSPELRYFDYSGSTGSHAFEITLDYSGENFDLSTNYVINEAGGVGSLGGDFYIEAGYSFNSLRLFAGAGNGWHTYDADEERNIFAVCNLGLEVSKIILITEHFSIPVTGQLIFNPDREQMFLVAGFTF